MFRLFGMTHSATPLSNSKRLPQLILGSGSPRRRELLLEAGFEFEVLPPDDQVEQQLVDEGLCSSCGPVELVLKLAIAKAADVVRKVSETPRTRDAVVLAADTVAECQGQILGKPTDEEHARAMLELMRGREHRVITGFCLCDVLLDEGGVPDGGGLRDGERNKQDARIEHVVTSLKMDAISDAEIDDYLASGGWQGKAGGFGYQDRLGWIHIHQGSESNVVGLPMERITPLLSDRQVLPRGGG